MWNSNSWIYSEVDGAPPLATNKAVAPIRANLMLYDDPKVLAEDVPERRLQRQDSLEDQLDDLSRVAAKLGMWDAEDWIREQRDRVIQ